MKERICQSCGMPMATEELLGTNQNGSKNDDYCCYCFQDGKFASEVTMEEMVEICVPHMVHQGMKEEQSRQIMKSLLPTLKRWA
ncbi:hypothetical protein HNQ80_000492 [Anaerosolibacter carboniphilus]|uniref:Putative zinc ribbon domain-containing protein n=1 Tax=Anaerosolibacter carboniphilus TaxID=1417629 RepID=A0A841KTZ8_9FIRM|nr:zinc ribbon domain-containing protein [Anaerosolibacter carboniphilus]MBB6214412.1 hypothetical protein [Anaerosolibacter carboniphilus]